jgi:hypothetical protein
MGWLVPPYSAGYLVEGTQPPANFAIGLGLVAAFMDPAQINIGLMMTGAFGLGPLQFDLNAQLGAALGCTLAWNPSAAISANAQIGASLSGLIPDLSINASIIGDLQMKIGGIQLLINMGLGLVAQIPSLMAALNGFMNMSTGGAYFGCYFGPASGIRPMSSVAGLIGGGDIGCLVMAFSMPKAAFQAAVGGLFATSP